MRIGSPACTAFISVHLRFRFVTFRVCLWFFLSSPFAHSSRCAEDLSTVCADSRELICAIGKISVLGGIVGLRCDSCSVDVLPFHPSSFVSLVSVASLRFAVINQRTNWCMFVNDEQPFRKKWNRNWFFFIQRSNHRTKKNGKRNSCTWSMRKMRRQSAGWSKA